MCIFPVQIQEEESGQPARPPVGQSFTHWVAAGLNPFSTALWLLLLSPSPGGREQSECSVSVDGRWDSSALSGKLVPPQLRPLAFIVMAADEVVGCFSAPKAVEPFKNA